MIGKNKVAELGNVVYRENLKSINEDLEVASHKNKTKKLKPKIMENT